MTKETRAPAQPAVRPRLGPQFVPPPGERRTFSDDLKRQIVDESCLPNASVTGVARRYRIATSLLFRWRRAAGVVPPPSAAFVPVEVSAAGDGQPQPAPAAATDHAPLIVARPSSGVEIELMGGRRVRFDRDVDAETMKRVVAALEGAAP